MVGESVSSNTVSGRSIFGRVDTATTAMSANKEPARSRDNIFGNPNCRRRYARDERLSTKIVNLMAYLASVACGKFGDGSPFVREESIFRQHYSCSLDHQSISRSCGCRVIQK